MPTTSTAIPDDLMSPPRLAAMTGIALATIYGWTRSGVSGHKLRSFRRGRLMYIRPSWLAAFIEATQR